MYYTYILRSYVDNHLYIGYTSDLKRRVEEHNCDMVEVTKYRLPLQLLYYEACLVRLDAIQREKALKTGFGRMYIKNRLSNL